MPHVVPKRATPNPSSRAPPFAAPLPVPPPPALLEGLERRAAMELHPPPPFSRGDGGAPFLCCSGRRQRPSGGNGSLCVSRWHRVAQDGGGGQMPEVISGRLMVDYRRLRAGWRRLLGMEGGRGCSQPGGPLGPRLLPSPL
jgi:hypothetical protein